MPPDRSDVERLLRTLLPAVVAVGGCDPKATAKVDDVARVETDPEDDRRPEVAESETGRESSGGSETPEDETTPLVEATPVDSDPLQVGKPQPRPERPRPTCPSGTWCTDQSVAGGLAPSGGKLEMGCPSDIALRPDKPFPEGFPQDITGFDASATTSARAAGDPDACCYAWYRHCPGGRPLLDGSDQPVVAPLRRGHHWSSDAFVIPGTGDAQRYAAEAWLADAAAEHASVASFGRVALELLALGAPPELIEGAHLAALDEIRHAKICLALARACGAEALEPGALPSVPQRPADLVRFAVDTFVEGCVGETTAALVVTRAAAGAETPAVAEALRQIADEEGRHARLAWRMLDWAVAMGGTPVVEAIRERASHLHAALDPGMKPAPSSSALPEPEGIAALGRLDARLQAQARRDAWQGIIAPMLARLARRDGKDASDPGPAATVTA